MAVAALGSLALAGATRAATRASRIPPAPAATAAAGEQSRPLIAGISEEEARREFQAICESLRTGDNAYFSDRAARQLEADLPAVAGDPVPEASLLGALAKEKLKLAQPRLAIDLFERALGLIRGHEAQAPDGLLSSLHWYQALAWLGYAEDQNCIAHNAARSCILPVKGDGVHSQPEAARKAGDLFLAYARAHPRNVQAAWLLNVARQVSGDWPDGVPVELRLPDGALESRVEFPEWRNRAPELGVAAIDLAGGASMEDFDGDGLLDLVSTTWDPCGPMKAFRNDGKGGFEDVAEAWGLSSQLGGLNLMHADYDGDGAVDLLVLRGAWMLEAGKIRKSLLRNELRGAAARFVDVTREAGLAEPSYPTQAAGFADYDGDGDLDLYVGAEATGANPFPSQLFRNRGDGTFTDVARAAGVENLRYTKAVAWGDYDDDGYPDLFVSNFGDNRLYRNDGDGTFTDVAPELGLAKTRAPESFPAWFFDYDNDGDLDLFVADYRQQPAQVSASYFGATFEEGHPLLYRNDGGRFVEVAREIGLGRPAMPMGANYGDLDNDGWLDLYLGTGEPDLASLMPNQMYRGEHGRFVDVTFAGGFGLLPKGHGVAFGDIDNDGDQDLFHQLGGFFPGDEFANALFENPGPAGSWVTLRLEGRRANRFGVGGRIEVQVLDGGVARSIHVLVGSGGSFGASSLQQEIGLGGAERIERLIVRWPRPGGTQVFEQVEVGRFYRVIEGESELQPIDLPRIKLGASGG
ncbi:MAG TPA: CRTAC1 family protein [Thermoanaerobaculia bacterium]|nr:CRTAC1 family protein [Thermoanaerobaculia bacterium]